MFEEWARRRAASSLAVCLQIPCFASSVFLLPPSRPRCITHCPTCSTRTRSLPRGEIPASGSPTQLVLGSRLRGTALLAPTIACTLESPGLRLANCYCADCPTGTLLGIHYSLYIQRKGPIAAVSSASKQSRIHRQSTLAGGDQRDHDPGTTKEEYRTESTSGSVDSGESKTFTKDV